MGYRVLLLGCLFGLGGALASGCGGDDEASPGAAGSAGSGGASGSGGGDAASDSGGNGGTAGGGGTGGSVLDAGPDGDAGMSCPRAPSPADALRKVVVGHPFGMMGNSDRYEVLDMSTSGQLSVTGIEFNLGRAFSGEIAFTPDGEVGIVAEDDGKLGVFRISGNAVEVVEAAYSGTFYAGAVTVGPSGDVVYVQDEQWRNNGGGIYALDIGCDGRLSNERKVAEAKLPYGFAFDPNDSSRALVFARDILTSPANQDLHYLTWSSTPALLSGTKVFPDDEAIVSSLVFTHDGKYALMGDNAGFATAPNRVGVAKLDQGTLSGVQVLTPVEDPFDIATSPFDDAAIVVSGFGDAIFVLDYDSSLAQPFSVRGELAYQGGKPQLPADAVMITRGTLSGRVLIAENTGVRSVQFAQNAMVTDLGLTNLGMGSEHIVGAIGVQP